MTQSDKSIGNLNETHCSPIPNRTFRFLHNKWIQKMDRLTHTHKAEKPEPFTRKLKWDAKEITTDLWCRSLPPIKKLLLAAYRIRQWDIRGDLIVGPLSFSLSPSSPVAPVPQFRKTLNALGMGPGNNTSGRSAPKFYLVKKCRIYSSHSHNHIVALLIQPRI